MRGPLLVNPNSSSLDWIALSKNFTVKVIQGDHKAFFVSGVHNKVTFLYCRWCAAVVWIYTANGLWQGDPFSPNNSQFPPFPCQFDELLSTDNLAAD
jgi:hypothetical protein